MVDLSGPHANPHSDVVSQLVYSGHSSDVTHTLVDGQVLMAERKLLTLDERKVVASASAHAARLAAALE